MIRKEISVTQIENLQSRAAVQIVQLACTFESRLRLEQGTKTINAKSMMGVLSLGGAPKGSLTLVADGDDEQQAVAALVQLFSSDFAKKPAN